MGNKFRDFREEHGIKLWKVLNGPIILGALGVGALLYKTYEKREITSTYSEEVFRQGKVLEEMYFPKATEFRNKDYVFTPTDVDERGASSYILKVKSDERTCVLDIADSYKTKESLDSMINVGSEIRFRDGYREIDNQGDTQNYPEIIDGYGILPAHDIKILD